MKIFAKSIFANLPPIRQKIYYAPVGIYMFKVNNKDTKTTPMKSGGIDKQHRAVMN